MEEWFASLSKCVILYGMRSKEETQMIRFNCDYHEGAHPRIMEALVNTNMVQTIGYGEDEYCAAAKEAIKKVCKKI